ncbi:unnamed protein product [Cunninghamella blakesleeana]
MNDCVINNIENGKNWFFQNCQTQIQAQSIMNYVIELAKSTMIYKQRLHLLYLINDILHHADRRQQYWIKEAILPQLAILLHTVYHCPSDNINENQQKVMKVVNIWNEKNIFNPMIINRLRFDITQPMAPSLPISQHPPNFYHHPPPFSHPPPPSLSHPPMAHPPIPHPSIPRPSMPHPPLPHPSVSKYSPHPPMTNPSRPPSHLPIVNPPTPSHMPISNPPSRPPMSNIHSYSPPNTNPNPPKQQEVPVITKKKYYELPAGLMAIALKIDHPPYTPIDPLSIQSKPQRPVPSKDMLSAVDQFYSGLENNEKSEIETSELHKVGWERGFLDSFYKKFQTTLEQRMKSTTSQTQRKHKDHDDDRHRRRNENSNRRRSPSYDRGRSPRRDRSSERRRSRYYSRSRSRSYSRSRSRSYSRSRSRSYSRSRSRSRSRSPRRSHHRQSNQRSRQRSTSRDRYRKSSRSSPPPSSSLNPSLSSATSTNAPALYPATSGSGRIGLGHSSSAAGDAFDEFRKRSSYNFIKEINRRDASGGPKCYNCGNYGHFARNCDANN